MTAERLFFLTVGDGNFSFSLSLANKLKKSLFNVHICATSYEDYSSCIKKYGEICDSNILKLKDMGCLVLHSIDATRLEQCLAKHGQWLFYKIIFNFPHTGRKASIKQNRNLLMKFCISAAPLLLPNGIIELTLCAGQGGTPADSKQREKCNHWQVVEMAAQAGLILTEVSPFVPGNFPEYLSTGHRGGERSFHTHDAITHVFVKEDTPPVFHVDWKAAPFRYHSICEKMHVDEKALKSLPSGIRKRFELSSCEDKSFVLKHLCGVMRDHVRLMCSEQTSLLVKELHHECPLQKHCNHIRSQIDEEIYPSYICCSSTMLLNQISKHLNISDPSVVIAFELPVIPIFNFLVQDFPLHYEFMLVSRTSMFTCTLQLIAKTLFLHVAGDSLLKHNLPVMEVAHNDELHHPTSAEISAILSTYICSSNIKQGILWLMEEKDSFAVESLVLITSDVDDDETNQASYVLAFEIKFQSLIDGDHYYAFVADVDVLACFALKGLSTRERSVLWSMNAGTQELLIDAFQHQPHQYIRKSIYQSSYTYHISFWIMKDIQERGSDGRTNFTEGKFKELLWNVCDDLLVSVELLENYRESEDLSSRTSRCYSLTYSSHDYSFSKSDSLKLQDLVRDALDNYLNVSVR